MWVRLGSRCKVCSPCICLDFSWICFVKCVFELVAWENCEITLVPFIWLFSSQMSWVGSSWRLGCIYVCGSDLDPDTRFAVLLSCIPCTLMKTPIGPQVCPVSTIYQDVPGFSPPLSSILYLIRKNIVSCILWKQTTSRYLLRLHQKFAFYAFQNRCFSTPFLCTCVCAEHAIIH